MLRDYQKRLYSRVRLAFGDGHRKVLMQCPTGGGKTWVAAYLVEQAYTEWSRVLYLVPRTEIFAQTARKLVEVGLDYHAVRAGRPTSRVKSHVVLAMTQTFSRRPDAIPNWEPDLVVIDEAHLYLEAHANLINRWPKARIIPMTATPCRLDGRPLTTIADVVVSEVQTSDLIRDGWLAPVCIIHGESPDLGRVKMRAGEYDPLSLGAAYQRKGVIGDVVATWEREASDRQTLVFCASKPQSQALAAAFCAAGYRFAHLDAKSTKKERKRVLGLLEAGELDGITNVGLFVEGIDLPALSCVVLATSTMSLSRYLQMIGRGMRTAPNKADLLYIDHSSSGNWREHGMPWDDRTWDLDGSGRIVAPRGTPRLEHQARGARRELEPLGGRMVAGGRSRAPGQAAIMRRASQSILPRPCPGWARGVAAQWHAAERKRYSQGLALPLSAGKPATGYTERACLQALGPFAV